MQTSQPGGNRIYVAGLDGVINEQDLRTYFEQFGTLTDVYIPNNVNTGQKKHFGFITFKEEATAKEVMSASPHQVKHVTVDIKACLPKGGIQPKGEGKGKMRPGDAGLADGQQSLAALASFQQQAPLSMLGVAPTLMGQVPNAQLSMPSLGLDTAQFAGSLGAMSQGYVDPALAGYAAQMAALGYGMPQTLAAGAAQEAAGFGQASLLQAALGSGQEQLQLDAQQLQAMAGYMDPAAYGQAHVSVESVATNRFAPY
mmetsp:Transcript_42588/g.97681  ORF Transcript_42588/g.97681 Transcript_42588/m.97681 type:complete len:256 (-) Transcript_42588:46-813(-)